MDSHAPRRPPRALPSSTAPPPRRLFQTTHAPPGPRAPSRATTASKPSTVHIPPDASTNPDADLVERDSQGNYKIIAAPAAMRLAIEKPMTAEEEEREQERQVIALYGRSGAWSDQAGEKAVHVCQTHTQKKQTQTQTQAGGLSYRMEKLSFDADRLSLGTDSDSEDQDEDEDEEEDYERGTDDGWGYWDAHARIYQLEKRAAEEEVAFDEAHGLCHWINERGEIVWVHADRCAAVQEEIEGALKSSMSRMIASLETDKWMFEGEGGRKN